MYRPPNQASRFQPRSSRWIFTLCILMCVCALAFAPLGILQSGLDAPAPVAAFVNGALPDGTPPSISSWTVEEAFPNLTFIDPIQFIEIPTKNRFLMAGKSGFLWDFSKDPTTTTKHVMLDITSQVYTAGDAGVLGVAFHPDFGNTFSTNGSYLYVYYRYTPLQGAKPMAYNRLSRFTVNLSNLTIDPASEYVMIQQFDRHDWHNGGSMFFGNDGFLYLTVGDEGRIQDFYNSAQQLNKGLFSGILRIDVDQDPSKGHPIRRQPLSGSTPPTGWPGSFSQGYYIPNDNPWQSASGSLLEEFFAVGLRSPHRMDYDQVTGNIWVGDVGGGQREEISILGYGDNAQWPYREGNLTTTKAKPFPLIGTDRPPVFEYDRSMGSCVIGGFVYRGNKYPSLQGKYIFGDHTVRKIWTLTYNSQTGIYEDDFLTTVPAFGVGSKSGISHFSTDSDGEIYVLKLFGTNYDGGKIYKLKGLTFGPQDEPPGLLSEVGIFKDMQTLEPEDFMIPYELNEPFWSDDALKFRWMIIPNDGTMDTPGEKIKFSENGDWEFPVGAVTVKHFEMQVDESQPHVTKRLETRLMIKDIAGQFYGLTYKWRDDQTEADLLGVGRYDTVGIQTPQGLKEVHWYYPDQQECMVCHNGGSKWVLGPKTRQLNGDITYFQTGRQSNQLKTLAKIQAFDQVPDTNNLGNYLVSANQDDAGASLELRARSYLDANCAYCHRAGNSIQANFDARLSKQLGDQGLVYGFLHSQFGLYDPRVIVPGDPEHSILYQRIKAVHDPMAMPPLAKNKIDEEGVNLIYDWIMSMDPASSVGTAAGAIVGDFQADFQGSAAPPNWEYLWNSGGPIGNDANYSSLVWNGLWYDSDGVSASTDPTDLAHGSIKPTGGHPGWADWQSAYDRYVIVGYTVPYSGEYVLDNTSLTNSNSACGDGVELRVYVNNSLRRTILVGNGATEDFYVNFGLMTAGDKIYVAVGPGAHDYCDGFDMDFGVRLANPKSGQRIVFDPILPRSTNQPPITLNATTTSGLPVSYSLISGPATLSNGVLTPTGGYGEVIVRASQEGNDDFIEAPTVERSFWMTPGTGGSGTGLSATYYSDKNLQTPVLTRLDSVIDFYWGSESPTPATGYNDYSVAWEGEIESPVSETVTFRTTTDDGVRLFVDGQLIIDQWTDQPAASHAGSISLNAWQRVPIRMEFYEHRVYASAKLEWFSNSIPATVVPQAFLYPNPGTTFPVEFLSFDGRAEGSEVWLDWQTASEIQSDYFEVERAPESMNFEPIGRVAAKGTSQAVVGYQFIDPAPYVGKNYYRLRQVDLDGNYTTTQSVEVIFDQERWQVFPNPVRSSETLNLLVHSTEGGQIHIQMWGIKGEKVWDQKLDVQAGSERYRLSTEHISPGTYLLAVVQGGKRSVKKIRIQ
ncbi:MAG: PQQ-dependent sugar dehydrogenase [Bacteroidota bacterium]